MEVHQVADGVEDVVVAEQSSPCGAVLAVLGPAELLVELVATHPGEVVPLRVAEQGLDEAAGRLHGGRLAGAQLAVQVEQRLVLVGDRVPLQGVPDRLGAVEQRQDLLVGLGDAEGAQEGGDVLAALAIDPDADGVPLVGVELEPGAPAGDDLGRVDVAVGGLVERLVEVDPGDRTNWLTTTRSVPLMMKTPFSVMIGKSPRKTCCSLISPVWRLKKRAVTNSGLA